MGAASDDEDIFRNVHFVDAKVAPALGDNGTLSGLLNCVKDDLRQFDLVIYNDRTKANIYWLRAGVEKSRNLIGRSVVGFRGEKAEATDVDMVTPVFWFGKNGWRPGQ